MGTREKGKSFSIRFHSLAFCPRPSFPANFPALKPHGNAYCACCFTICHFQFIRLLTNQIPFAPFEFRQSK